MTEMTRAEKAFVNRRSTRSLARLLDRVERSSPLSLSPTSQVLELGGGNGRLSLLVNERYHPAEIHLTDYDPDQLAVARHNLELQYGSVPGSIILEQADATRMAYPNDSLDLVIAHYVLHHLGKVPDIFQGLDEIYRVLRPGGRFFYVEMFHKKAIQDHLGEIGFSTVYSGRAWRFLRFADLRVVRKSARRAPSSVPVGST
jgi:ubiquinone/menaquinone biosynthesis C-methylase UbiE